MAFNPIDPSTIESGDAVTQELFDTVRTDLNDHETRVASLEAISAVTIFTGEIRQYASAVAPSGWLSCDGSAISRVTFANLFAVCGVVYGPGDGSTTFNIPDARSRCPVGVNAGGGGGLTARNMGDKFGAQSVNTAAHNHQWYNNNGVGSSDETFDGGGNLTGFSFANKVFAGIQGEFAFAVSKLALDGYTNNASPSVVTLSPSITWNFIIKT